MQKIGNGMVPSELAPLPGLLFALFPIAMLFAVGYFLSKAAVKNGIKEALRDIGGINSLTNSNSKDA